MAYLDLEDGRLFYRASGAGAPAIVFVHGFACAHGDWDAQVEHFSATHRTVACDLRGHGRSGAFTRGFDIETLGADVVHLLVALGLDDVVLVGHSMGCRVVLEAAGGAPERVRGVVLADGSRLAGGRREEVERRIAARIADSGYEGFVGALFQGMFFEPFDEAARAHIVERAGRLRESAGAPLMAAFVGWDAERVDSALSGTRAPLLVIQSTYLDEARRRVRMEAGQSTPWTDLVRRLVPGSAVTVMAGTGHFPMIEDPARFNGILGSFVDTLSR